MKPEASPAPQPEPTPRCAVCGWPLAETRDNGCRPGDCSMRPLPEQAYDAARANNEYAAFWGDSFVKKWKAEQPSPPAGAREHKENEVMKTIRDANGTTIWWGKPLAGRGEAAEQEQNKAGISASSGTTFITSSAPNERPASQPAGARESAEQFFNSLPEETKYKWAGEVKPHWAFEFSEAYAKKETERADAAERERNTFSTTIVRLDRALEFRQKECESLRTELRDMREALEHVIKHVTFSRNLCRDCAKAEALLSRKGEGS